MNMRPSGLLCTDPARDLLLGVQASRLLLEQTGSPPSQAAVP